MSFFKRSPLTGSLISPDHFSSIVMQEELGELNLLLDFSK